MIEHVLKQPGEPVGRHQLVGITEIAIVVIGPHRDAGSNRFVELRRIETPMFSGIAAEESFVELTSYLTDDDILGCLDAGDRLGPVLQKFASFGF